MQIDDVVADGPAARAGLTGGDVIVKILDRKIGSIEDFMYALQDCSPGQVVPVAVWRDGETLNFEVELAARSIEQ
jgi:S1-C subfamily serine protease